MPTPTPILPARSQSLWFDRDHTAAPSSRAAVPSRVDVVVVGAGIAGLSTAVMLARAGVSVSVIDMAGVARGATGHSSAKISVLQNCATSAIADRRGPRVADSYVQANRFGAEWISSRVRDRNVDCQFERHRAVTYAVDPTNVDVLARERDLLRSAGLDADVVDPGLPFPTAGGVRLADQAQFDPVPFLLDLATEIADFGGSLHTGIRAHGIDDGSAGVTVHTDDGSIRARHMVAATGLPFTDRGLLFARCTAESSYVVACQVESLPPEGMYLSHDGPKRSLRTARAADGSTLLLVGGESHTTGQGGDTNARYERLVRWADDHFGCRTVTHRFMTEDFMTLDDVPYVGPLHPGPTSVLVTTGFNKWGFTNGVAAAHALAASVTGAPAPGWAADWTASRLPREGLGTFVKNNADVAAHMVGGWLGSSFPHRGPAPGQGRVVPRRSGLVPTGRVAVSRSADGAACAVSGVCPHLGAILTWNPAERTWDCPLHGSRFEADGTLLHGPATDDLRADG